MLTFFYSNIFFNLVCFFFLAHTEGVGKSSLISTFVSRYFSEVVPGIMSRVRLPPDPHTMCVTTIIDSQAGDAALIQAVTSSLSSLQNNNKQQRASDGSLAALLERATETTTTSTIAGGETVSSSLAIPHTHHGVNVADNVASSSTAAPGYAQKIGKAAAPVGPIENVDSIVLVYDLDRVETFFRLENHWLPLIERCYGGKVRDLTRTKNYVDPLLSR